MIHEILNDLVDDRANSGYRFEYEIIDLNEIADNFDENNIYSEINKIKFDFNPTITEYVGELDLIISEWKFKILEKNN